MREGSKTRNTYTDKGKYIYICAYMCVGGRIESLPAEELECRGQPELDSDTDSIPSPLPTPETVGSVDEDMRSPPSRGDPEAANGDCPLPPTWPVEFFDRKTGLVMHNPVVLSNGVSYDLEVRTRTLSYHWHIPLF